ncbi:hypothetical protein EIK77_001844 [Talaromyces pinophilus]|nr:hypothetical protein EIK77_001844 [Talaromyces pinophilus]
MAPAAVADAGLGDITPQTDTPQSSSLPRLAESLLKAASTVQSFPAEESTISEQYVPVGILRRSSAQFPEQELYNLQNHGWIQTRWNVYETYPGWSFVQVYVLPHDVARIAVSRSSNTLRKALRAVMANIDKSPTAWNGDFEAGPSEQGKKAAEDESLWYIFNTLDNPNPTIDDVRDEDGKLAMQELMASSRESKQEVRETSSVIGLKTPLHPYQCRSAATMIQREVQPRQMLDPRLEVCKTPLGQEYYYDKEEGTLLRSKRIYEEACGGEYTISDQCPSLADFCRNPCRDYGLRENINLLSSHPLNTRPFSSHSDRISGDQKSNPQVCWLANADGSRHSRSIFCFMAQSLSAFARTGSQLRTM